MEKAAKKRKIDFYKVGLVLAVTVFIILSSSYALSEEEMEFYSDKEYIKMNLSISSGLEIEAASQSYEIDYIRASMLFFPRDNFMQKVNSISTDPDAQISEDSIFFEWRDPPAQDIRYSYEADIEVRNKIIKVKSKIHYPLKQEIPAEARDYILTTKHIDSHDPDIIALASSLAAGEDDLYIIMHKLSAWTKENIVYNLSTMTESISQSASWTLENRQGVCDELTSLFIAMARSLGIPARFIAGIAYTNSDLFDQRWGPHGWAEVYFPGKGWIPFDPTYGQIGFIDPSHIALRSSPDPDDATTKFEWKARNIDIKTQQLEVSVDAYETGRRIASPVRLEVDVLKKAIGFGSYQLVEVKVSNLADYYTATELYVSKPKEVKIIREKGNSIALRPYENKTVYWIMKVEDGLDSSLLYRFPIKIISSRNATADTEFSSYHEHTVISLERIENILSQRKEEEEKRYSMDVSMECRTDKETIYAGDDAYVLCWLKNTGNTILSNVSICMDKGCIYHDISINQEAEARFLLESMITGKQQKTVTAGNNDISKLAIVEYDILDKPLIRISNISYPKSIGYNKNFNLNFTLIKESRSIPENVSVNIRAEGMEKSWDIEKLEADQEFVINMNSKMLDIGSNRISISIEYHDAKGRDYSGEQDALIELSDVSLAQSILIKINSIARRISFYVQGILERM